MPVDINESLFSATTLLWLVVAVMAAVILFGSLHRRRSQLTSTLRDYVDQNQGGSKGVPSSSRDKSRDDSSESS